MRLFKSQEEKQQIAAARSDFQDFVKAAASAEPEQARKLAVAFKSNPRLGVLSEKERKIGSHDAFRTYAENVLSDDHLTIDEEMAFQDVGEALGINPDDFQGPYRDLLARLVVAQSERWSSRCSRIATVDDKEERGRSSRDRCGSDEGSGATGMARWFKWVQLSGC
jgi:hypothetical protein